jgi:heparan-sulfate lyase
MEQEGLQLQEEEGWVSFIYTQKERRPAFRYRIDKTTEAGARFVTVVAPYEGSAYPKVTAEILGKLPAGSSRMELKVNFNGMTRKLSYQLPGK